MECIICYAETTEILSCGHYCHAACIETWLKVKNIPKCVLCFKYLDKYIKETFLVKEYEFDVYVPDGTREVKCENCGGIRVFIPDSVIKVVSHGNRRLKLIGMKNVEFLQYTAAGIEKLDIPKNIKYLDCSYNLLTEINIPDGAEVVDCTSNRLKELFVPKSVKRLYCGNNRFLREITIPKDIEFFVHESTYATITRY